MWKMMATVLANKRELAVLIGFLVTVLTQGLHLASHKFGLDAELAAKIPGVANAISGAIVIFVVAYVGAHAHAEAGQATGDGIAAGLTALRADAPVEMTKVRALLDVLATPTPLSDSPPTVTSGTNAT